MKRISWKIYLGAAVLIVMLLRITSTVMAGPSTAPRDSDRKTAQRTTTSAGAQDARNPLSPSGMLAGNGIVEPRDRETKVAAPVAGRIAAVLVQEGDRVAVGAPLVRLEDAPERGALAAAEGDLAAAVADYDKTIHGQRREDVDAAIGDADAADARARQSADARRRIELAAQGGAATTDDLDKARRQAESDSSAAEASEARRRAMAAGSRPEDIVAARARVDAARGHRDEAEANLERLTVRAPIAGEVLQLKYRAGEYVSPSGDPLAVMGDTRTLRVRVDVDERDVGRLALGARAFITAEAFPNRRFSGTVVEVGRRMGRKNVRTDDPTERIDTKIIEAVVELDSASGLIPGLRVTGYIDPGK